MEGMQWEDLHVGHEIYYIGGSPNNERYSIELQSYRVIKIENKKKEEGEEKQEQLKCLTFHPTCERSFHTQTHYIGFRDRDREI